MRPAENSSVAPGPPPSADLVDTPELRDELECPLCGYSLRGLSGTSPEPGTKADAKPEADGRARWILCPECGHPCYWRQLLRARQFRQDYLFEHHPRRNVWSFFRTLFAGLRPKRFWSSLNAGHEIRPRRLLLYWAATSLLIVLSCVVGRYAIELIGTVNQDRLFPRRIVRGTTPAFLGFFQSSDLEFELSLIGVVWPWVTFVVLLIFQASMRRARLRTGHVLRCVVYTGDVFVWVGVVAVLLQIAQWAWSGFIHQSDQQERARLAAAGAAVLVVAATYRLAVAYRNYLRFDHAIATAVASQVMVVVFLITAFALAARQFYWLFM